MPPSLRNGFYGGLGAALSIGLFLCWLWQPERQVRRHTENLFRTIERKNWQELTHFIGDDYRDQWGHDRTRVLEHAREVFRYLRGVQITSSSVTVRIDKRRARWNGK